MSNLSVLDRAAVQPRPIWPWWLDRPLQNRAPLQPKAFENSVAARFTIPASHPVPIEDLPTYARVIDTLFEDALEPTTGESAVSDIMGVQSRSGGCVILIVGVATHSGPNTLFVRLSSRGDDWQVADFDFRQDADLYTHADLPHFATVAT